MSDAQIRAERRGYLDQARAVADELGARHRAQPPAWNPKTGDSEIDSLRWFDYVHADAPWDRVPKEHPLRPPPSRCHAA